MTPTQFARLEPMSFGVNYTDHRQDVLFSFIKVMGNNSGDESLVLASFNSQPNTTELYVTGIRESVTLTNHTFFNYSPNKLQLSTGVVNEMVPYNLYGHTINCFTDTRSDGGERVFIYGGVVSREGGNIQVPATILTALIKSNIMTGTSSLGINLFLPG
jgi:hypothetical protein